MIPASASFGDPSAFSRDSGRAGVVPSTRRQRQTKEREMRHMMLAVLGAALAGSVVAAQGPAKSAPAGSGPEWSANMSAIEACSCPMFCQCYFNHQPAAHGGHEGH